MSDKVGELGPPSLASMYLGYGIVGCKSTSLRLLVDLNKTSNLESTDLLLPNVLLGGRV